MATRYVEEIMRFQPHGPYRLAGLCFGGLVAYEVARRLAERGEEIALLTLIDSSPLVNRTLRGTRSRRELERLKWSVFVSSSVRGQGGVDPAPRQGDLGQGRGSSRDATSSSARSAAAARCRATRGTWC